MFTRLAIVNNLPFIVFDHSQVKYYMKAVKISRPISVSQNHVMGVHTLQPLIMLTSKLKDGIVYKAIFLVGYFGFFQL